MHFKHPFHIFHSKKGKKYGMGLTPSLYGNFHTCFFNPSLRHFLDIQRDFLHERRIWKLKCPKPDKMFLFHLCWLCGCSANLIMTSQVCWRHRRHPLSTALSAWSHGNHLHDMDKDMMFGRYLVIAWVWVPICSTVNTHILM